MGQHKYNPNCQLAKEGKLPPKPKKMSKREWERLMREYIYGRISKDFFKARTGWPYEK